MHGAGRKVLAPRRSKKADHPRATFSVFSLRAKTRVVLVPSARIFLLKWYVEASARTILAPCRPCKLPSLGGS